MRSRKKKVFAYTQLYKKKKYMAMKHVENQFTNVQRV